MTLAELLEQLESIHQERTLEAHHDDMFFKTYADVEALDKVINLMKYLADKDPAYRLTVEEILNAVQIEY